MQKFKIGYYLNDGTTCTITRTGKLSDLIAEANKHYPLWIIWDATGNFVASK
jgi:hypothetical protein